MHPTITLIGSGNMGSALIRGLIASGHPANKIWATDPSQEKLDQLKQSFPIQTTTDNDKAIQEAQVLILAVKPQILAQVAKEHAASIQKHKPLVISIAAGITLKRLEEWLGPQLPLIRCMPNTPALVGQGASALFANPHCNSEQRERAAAILDCVGTVVWLPDEKQMDVVTALSGSGPAYFLLLMEALTQAAQELGLSAESARELCLQTAFGTACLAAQSSESFTGLREQVTSPGGTTAAALEVLEKGQLRDLIKQAISAAEMRSKELGSG